MRRLHLPRRTFLRGLGTAVALPMLDAMVPALTPRARAATAATRLAYLYVPNGVIMPRWTPATTGRTFTLPPTLAALAPVQSELTVLSGLSQRNGEALGDGPGDHARAGASFLTGAHPRKSDQDLNVGTSIDQAIAQHLRGTTRFASLELACDAGGDGGSCDSGYSCAYSRNLSWSSPTTPVAHESHPGRAFDRLFGNGHPSDTAAQRARRQLFGKSVLDFVADDTRALQARLGAGDRRKLDEFLDSVRQVEVRVGQGGATCGGAVRPAGDAWSYDVKVGLMYDLLTLAFRCDVTRVATFMLAAEGSNQTYAFAGVPRAHHEISHHQGDAEKIDWLAAIDAWHVGQLARFLTTLQSTPDGDGSLLDHAMILYGSGLADGNAHTHHDLPILLAGRASGALAPGQHLAVPSGTPLNNVFLAQAAIMGAPLRTFGDATGALTGL